MSLFFSPFVFFLLRHFLKQFQPTAPIHTQCSTWFYTTLLQNKILYTAWLSFCQVACIKPYLNNPFWHKWPAFTFFTFWVETRPLYYRVQDDWIHRHRVSLSLFHFFPLWCLRRGGRLIPISHERLHEWSFKPGEEREGQRWYSDTGFSFQAISCFLYVMLTLLFDTSGKVDIFITNN